MKKTITTLLVLFAGCNNYNIVDPLLQPHMDKLYQLYDTHCPTMAHDARHMRILVDPFMSKSIAGACYYTGKGNYIHISEATSARSPEYIQHVILHELGHCVLGLKHTETGVMQIPVNDENIQLLADNDEQHILDYFEGCK